MWLCRSVIALILCFALLPIQSFASQEGLAAAYDFDTDGIVNDVSGNGKNGTAYNTQWEDGTLKFTRGKTSYVDLGNSFLQSLNNADAVTISLWVKHIGTPVDSDYIFYAANGGKAGLEIYLTPTALRICGRSSGDDTRWEKKYPPIENDRWYHLTAIWDYKNKKIFGYLNGKKLTNEGGSDNAAFVENSLSVTGTSNRCSISTRDLYKEFNGNIDEVRIYSRSLSEGEITALASTKQISAEPTSKELTSQLQSALQGTLVFAADYKDTFANGVRRRIDWSNDKVTPFLSDNKFYVPAKYVSEFFGQADVTDSTIELYGTKYSEIGTLAQALRKQYYVGNGAAIIGNSISSADYLDNIKSRLVNQSYVSADNDFTSGSSVIATENTVGLYLGSPGLVKLPSGALLASHDYFGGKNTMTEVIYKSTDDGLTWQKQSSVKNCTWASIFEHNGSVYLMGVSEVFGSIIIYKSTDEGLTWSQGSVLFPQEGKYHTAPVPVVKHNGRIYRAYESGASGTTAADFKAFVISAPEDSDLMLPQSWTKSNELAFDKSVIADWKYANAGWLEGNMTVSPDGELWNILRTTIPPNSDKAAVLKLDSETMTLRQDRNDAFISMPGGSHKFSVKYDDISKKYISIVNNNTDTQYFNQRNVLSLIYSDDLRNWNIAQTILADDSIMSWDESMQYIGYQYVDYIIDGNDIKMVVRQASDGALNYHDSNKIVFYKVPDFRKYLNSAQTLAEWDFESTEGNTVVGKGFNGTVSNQNISLESGYCGKGMNISLGSNDTHLSVTGIAKALDNRTAFTVSMRVNLRKLPESGEGNYQLFKICIDGNAGGAMAYLNTEGKMVFETRSIAGESIKKITSDTAFPADGWHHVAFVVDYKGKHISYYLDGKINKWTNVAAFSSNTFKIGAPAETDTMIGGAGSGAFNGKIDEIKIFPSRLSDKQINELLETKVKMNSVSGSEINRLSPGEKKLSVEVNQNTDSGLSFYCILYDKKSGKLLDVSVSKKQMSKDIPQVFDGAVNVPENFYDTKLKAYLWYDNLVPLEKGGIMYEVE